MTNETEYLFMLINHLDIFCVNFLFKIISKFSTELPIFFKLIWSSLCILDMSHLCVVNFFSHYHVDDLCTFLMMPFDEEEFLILMRSKVSIFLNNWEA